MDEASKTKKIWTKKEFNFFTGEGLDIGCGKDPIFENAQRFDQVHGDANHITKYIEKQYDYVFSSHCLEHMQDPKACIQEWYQLVKPGGYLIILVPDEDLYEQGCFPSRFNDDHKWTFTISKSRSWSPKSLNVLDLAHSLKGQIMSLELQDHNYDYSLYNHGFGFWGYRMWKWYKKWLKFFRNSTAEHFIAKIYRTFGGAFDQTWMGFDRLAQIQLIIKKPTNSGY